MLRRKLKFAFIAAGLVLAGCQGASEFAPNLHGETNGAIVGGKVVSPESQLIKQVAQLTLQKRVIVSPKHSQIHSSGCTTTFITRTIILTSAHCFGGGPTTGSVRFQADASGQTFSTPVLRYTYHSGYLRDKDAAHDIALLETKDPLPDGYIISKLTTQNYRLSRTAIATGFGRTYFDWEGAPTKGGQSGVLKYVLLKSGYHFLPSYSKFEVAMTKTDGISLGDSGGPLFVKDDNGALVQIGVAHGIYPYSAVYTSVSAHFDWIKAQIINLRSHNRTGWLELQPQL